MFSAYKPPDETNDWTDTLTQKIIPTGGAIAGGILAGIFTGGNPAAISAGAQSGYGSGEAIGGLINKKKGSENQSRLGTAAAIMGLKNVADIIGAQKKRTDLEVNPTGADPKLTGVSPTAGYIQPDQAKPLGVPDEKRNWRWGPPD